MFRIKMVSTMALAAALGLTVLCGPARARGPVGRLAGGYGGYLGAARFGLGPVYTGSYLPYRSYGLGYGGLGGYGLGYGGLGSYYGLYGSYGLGGYGLGLGGYNLGLRYGLGRGSLGIGVGNPGYYYGTGNFFGPSGIYGQNYPSTPLQPYGDDHPYGNGVYNYGGANPDFRQSMYPPPAPAGREEADVAHLQVIMPTADAQLWVNDTRTRQQGTDRAFVSPTLKPGKKFAYELRAVWTDRGRQVEQTRSISVQGGDRQVVDFTRPEAEQRGRPAPDRLEEQPPAPPDRPER